MAVERVACPICACRLAYHCHSHLHDIITDDMDKIFSEGFCGWVTSIAVLIRYDAFMPSCQGLTTGAASALVAGLVLWDNLKMLNFIVFLFTCVNVHASVSLYLHQRAVHIVYLSTATAQLNQLKMIESFCVCTCTSVCTSVDTKK